MSDVDSHVPTKQLLKLFFNGTVFIKHTTIFILKQIIIINRVSLTLYGY